MNTYIIIGTITILSIVLIFYLCKYHANLSFNILLRTVFGIACIYLLNTLLGEVRIVSSVGVNLVTIPVVALFGVPGVILLYGGTFFLKN